MTYSPTAFQFTQLAQAIWSDLGKVLPFHQFLATGGSTTTIENTIMDTENQQQDDGYAVDFTAIVVRDAGGLGAAPEGELQRISAFASGTTPIFTVDTAFSSAVVSGDEIMIANGDIPLREMYRLCNRALTELGDIENVDISLTTNSTGQYTLPVGTLRNHPIGISYADNDADRRIPITDFEVTADGYLFLPEYHESRQLYITYVGPHPKLTTYASVIQEVLKPRLVIAAATEQVMQWLNGTQAGGSTYSLQRENKAASKMTEYLAKDPSTKIAKQAKMFVVGRHVS